MKGFLPVTGFPLRVDEALQFWDSTRDALLPRDEEVKGGVMSQK